MYPKPTRAGPFSSFYVDPEHLLWVTTSQPGEPTTIRVYSSEDGLLTSTIEFPVELEIFEIGTSHILASFEDAEGFPHVVRYRVTR